MKCEWDEQIENLNVVLEYLSNIRNQGAKAHLKRQKEKEKRILGW